MRRKGSLRPKSTLNLLILIAGAMCFFGGKSIRGDGALRYEALEHLLSKGEFSLLKFSIIGPLFATPLWHIGNLFGDPMAWVSFFNIFVFLIGVGVLYQLLRPKIDPKVLKTFVILLLMASMFPFPIRTFYGETFSAMAVAIGIAALWTGRERLGFIALPLGVANTPAMLLGLLLSSAHLIYVKKKWRYAFLVVLAIVLIVLENGLHRGGFFTFGYDDGFKGPDTPLHYYRLAGFVYPLFFGVLSVVFSFGKGLLFFSPGLFLPHRDRVQTGWILFLVGMVLVYAKWVAWHGGWFWGPRYYLMASIPASLALAHWIHQSKKIWMRGVTLIALLFSFWVGLSGLVFGLYGMEVCIEENYRLESYCWYTPEFSALYRPFIDPKPLRWHDWLAIGIYGSAFLYFAWPHLRELLGWIRRRSARMFSHVLTIRRF